VGDRGRLSVLRVSFVRLISGAVGVCSGAYGGRGGSRAATWTGRDWRNADLS
jgi:hypothetical protein